jgi:hypothetical protein
MTPEITLPEIMDGFTLNPSIRYRPNWYFPMALGQLDILRRANTYRPKWYALPDEFNTPIPARETREFQIRLTPGSYVWGLLANQFIPLDIRFPNYSKTQPTFCMKITDSCTGIGFWEDFVKAAAFSGEQATQGDYRNMMLPHLLTQPRLIMEPGLLAVEIANVDATDLTCQLLILAAEPCEVKV